MELDDIEFLPTDPPDADYLLQQKLRITLAIIGFQSNYVGSVACGAN